MEKRKRASKLPYLTGMEALNYHGCDWHSFAYDFSRQYPKEVREWAGDWGVERKEDKEIANPVRAYLDYLFHSIRFLKEVPSYRVSDLAFSDEEEKQIMEKVKELLEPVFKGEEKELFEKWKRYNAGGEYEPARRTLYEREAWKRRFKKTGSNAEDLKERIRKAFDF
jgi:tRNA nucleotidyltransferase/poly(A) polymerase